MTVHLLDATIGTNISPSPRGRFGRETGGDNPAESCQLTSLKVMRLSLFMNFGEPVEKETIPDSLITYDRLIHLEMGHDSVDEKGPC